MSEQTQHRLDTETTQPADFATIKMTKGKQPKELQKKNIHAYPKFSQYLKSKIKRREYNKCGQPKNRHISQ